MVQVTPNARRSEVTGLVENMVRIRLQAPPVDGKANDALLRFLADQLHLPKRALTLVNGHTSRCKVVEIEAGERSSAELMQILLATASQKPSAGETT